jgi:hypothetical protein
VISAAAKVVQCVRFRRRQRGTEYELEFEDDYDFRAIAKEERAPNFEQEGIENDYDDENESDRFALSWDVCQDRRLRLRH